MDLNFLRGGSTASGIAVGLGAAVLLPVAARLVVGVGKPLVKETIKGGMYLTEKGRVLFADTWETVEDLTAEAKSEFSESKKARAKDAGNKTSAKKTQAS